MLAARLAQINLKSSVFGLLIRTSLDHLLSSYWSRRMKTLNTRMGFSQENLNRIKKIIKSTLYKIQQDYP